MEIVFAPGACGEFAVKLDNARVFVDHCTVALDAGELTPEDAAGYPQLPDDWHSKATIL